MRWTGRPTRWTGPHGRDWAQVCAADRMARAVHHLSRAVPDPSAAGDLLALAEFVTRRTS